MDTKTIYKQIQILFLAILAGLIIFLVVVFLYVARNGAIEVLTPSFETNMQSLILILTLAGIPASYMFHNKKTARINPDLDIKGKLTQYRRSLFIKYATLESLAFISLLAYLATASRSYLFTYLILLVVFALNYPGKQKVKQELKLENEQLNF